jgi:hypothetical protein
MLIPSGSRPTYGRKHPKDITGLTRTIIIFNNFCFVNLMSNKVALNS